MRVKCRDGSMTTSTLCHRGCVTRDAWRDERVTVVTSRCGYLMTVITMTAAQQPVIMTPSRPCNRHQASPGRIFIEKYLNILYPNVPMETAARGRWLRVSIIAGTVIMQLQFLCFPDRGVAAVHSGKILDLTWARWRNRHIQSCHECVAKWIMQKFSVQTHFSIFSFGTHRWV